MLGDEWDEMDQMPPRAKRAWMALAVLSWVLLAGLGYLIVAWARKIGAA